MSDPKLRTVANVREPYPMGKFPEGFVHNVAGKISSLIAVGRMDIEGKDWEKIFAESIGAKWEPSVVGLDDILMPEISAAWGAKTVKNSKPFNAKKIRLISGRNSPAYSYSVSDVSSMEPCELGKLILEIWNERVAALYKKYKTLRTVVLLKGPDLNKVSIFETSTVRYNPDEYNWEWNKNNNLVGRASNEENKFTWQPHGAQFTIHETVPDYALNIEIDPPRKITSAEILEKIDFDETHYRIVPRRISS